MHAVYSRPTEYQWIRNGTGVMVRKPPYSFKRLVNVYKVRLNVLAVNGIASSELRDGHVSTGSYKCFMTALLSCSS